MPRAVCRGRQVPQQPAAGPAPWMEVALRDCSAAVDARHAPLLTRRVRSLLCLHMLQHRRQPLVVDDISRLHRPDLVEHMKTEGGAFELRRKPAIRIVHHRHLLAHQPAAAAPGSASSGRSAASGFASPSALPARLGPHPGRQQPITVGAGPPCSPARARSVRCRQPPPTPAERFGVRQWPGKLCEFGSHRPCNRRIHLQIPSRWMASGWEDGRRARIEAQVGR